MSADVCRHGRSSLRNGYVQTCALPITAGRHARHRPCARHRYSRPRSSRRGSGTHAGSRTRHSSRSRRHRMRLHHCPLPRTASTRPGLRAPLPTAGRPVPYWLCPCFGYTNTSALPAAASVQTRNVAPIVAPPQGTTGYSRKHLSSIREAAEPACTPRRCSHSLPYTRSRHTCSTARRSPGPGRCCTAARPARAPVPAPA